MNGRYDTVVGGGPAGLNAALVLGRQRRRVLLLDSGEYRNEAAAEMHMFLSRDGADPADVRAQGRPSSAPTPPNTSALTSGYDQQGSKMAWPCSPVPFLESLCFLTWETRCFEKRIVVSNW